MSSRGFVMEIHRGGVIREPGGLTDHATPFLGMANLPCNDLDTLVFSIFWDPVVTYESVTLFRRHPRASLHQA